MSTDRDTTRIVRSWLEEGVMALPDRVLDAVLDQVPATPQRRLLWPPRRFAQVNRLVLVASAAIAVLVVAILGYNLLPGSGFGGKPTPSPTAVPTLAPTAPAEASKGPLGAGTYAYSYPDFTGTPFTFTVPGGWMLNTDSFIFKGVDWKVDGVALGTWKVTHVYPSACVGPRSLVPVGSKADLVAALASQTGHTTSGPTVVNLGGLPATRFEFSFPVGFDITSCDGGIARLWPDPGPDENGGLPMFAGQTTTVWVIEEGGAFTAVFTIRNATASAGDVAELQAVVDSVRFVR